MPSSPDIFRARSQLLAHTLDCRCMLCRDARQLLDEAAEEQRRKTLADLDAYVAETKDAG